MLDLTEPSSSGGLAGPGRRWRAARRPRWGPRGWCRCRGPRRRRRLGGSRPALARAWRITRSWEGPLGAVRPLEAPSWLTAEPLEQGEDLVAVALGVGEALEDQDADALGPADAVGGLGEGLAAPVGGEAALAGELDEQVGGREDGDPAGEGEAALAPPQRLRREVHRDQRGGTGGVDGDRRALEPERVGDAPGGDAARDAGAEVALQLGPLGAGGDGVAGSRRRRRRRWGSWRGRRDRSRALQRLPGGFEQQPLLRVHRQRLARGDAEEGGVELPRPREEAALLGVGRAGAVGVGVEERLEVPAAVGGEGRDRVAPLGDQLPQLLGGGGPAGVAAGHADYGYRLLARPGAEDGLDARPCAGRLFEQELRQGGGAGVVEDDGGRQPHPGGGVEAVSQLDRRQGVEARLLEGAIGLHALGGGVPEDRRDLLSDQLEDVGAALGLGHRGEGGGERARAGAAAPGGGREVPEEGRQGAGGGELRELLRRQGGGEGERLGGGEGAVEELQAELF